VYGTKNHFDTLKGVTTKLSKVKISQDVCPDSNFATNGWIFYVFERSVLKQRKSLNK